MKKVLLIILLIISGLNGFSQSRYVDLSARITSPKENDLIREGDVVSIEFYITNQGPDSLFKDDSLRYSLFYLYRSTDKRNVPFTRDVAPGDSLLFTDTLHMVGGASSERIRMGFHLVPVAFSYNETRPLTPEFFDDKDDNHSSFFVRYRLLSTERMKPQKGLGLYPNPCSKGKLTVELDRKHPVNVEVVSVTGEVLLARQSIRSGDFIDVQNLKSGLYLVRIKDEEGVVAIRKLLIP